MSELYVLVTETGGSRQLKSRTASGKGLGDVANVG